MKLLRDVRASWVAHARLIWKKEARRCRCSPFLNGFDSVSGILRITSHGSVRHPTQACVPGGCGQWLHPRPVFAFLRFFRAWQLLFLLHWYRLLPVEGWPAQSVLPRSRHRPAASRTGRATRVLTEWLVFWGQGIWRSISATVTTEPSAFRAPLSIRICFNRVYQCRMFCCHCNTIYA